MSSLQYGDTLPTTFTQGCPSCFSRSSSANPKSPHIPQEQTSLHNTELQANPDKATQLHKKLYLSRLELKELRNQLRHERARASDIHAQFAALLRISWQQGSLPEKGSFERLHDELQKIRDKLGVLEFDYDQKEDEYDVLEAELDEIKESGIQPNGRRSEASDDILGEYGQREPFHPPTTSSQATNTVPNASILEEYQSRLGDGNILWERLEDKLQAYDRIVKLHHTKSARSEEFTQAELQNIKDLEDGCKKAKLDLKELEKEIKSLGAQAMEAGFEISMPFWASSSEPVTQSNLISGMEQTTSPTVNHQSYGALPSLGRSVYSIRARINIWLLHILADSRLEQVRQEATLEAEGYGVWDRKSWTVSLLKWRRTGELDEDTTGRSKDQATFSTLIADGDYWIPAHLEILLTTSSISRAVEYFHRQFPASKDLPSEVTLSEAAEREMDSLLRV